MKVTKRQLQAMQRAEYGGTDIRQRVAERSVRSRAGIRHMRTILDMDSE